MRAALYILALSLVGCARPGIDELAHPRPTQQDRHRGEANWLQLEKAYVMTNFVLAQSTVGKPIFFEADLSGTMGGGRLRATARRWPIFSEEEQQQISKLSQEEQSEALLERFTARPRISCHWKFTRLQKRAARRCISIAVLVYGTLRSVTEVGIEVEPKDFAGGVCL